MNLDYFTCALLWCLRSVINVWKRICYEPNLVNKEIFIPRQERQTSLEIQVSGHDIIELTLTMNIYFLPKKKKKTELLLLKSDPLMLDI